jgi:hypothetical protein
VVQSNEMVVVLRFMHITAKKHPIPSLACN